MLPVPAGPLAENLIARALDALDELVPFGVVNSANDLLDGIKDFGFKTYPPIADEVFSVCSLINEALLRLAPAELHGAAAELGLQPTTLEWGARITALRERKLIREQAADLLADVDFDEVGYPDTDPEVSAAEHASLRFRVAGAVESLRTDPPTSWDRFVIDSMRCAIALHIAQIGDAFLQTSER